MNLGGLSTEIPVRRSNPFHKKWVMAVLLSSGLAMDYQARVAINSVFPLLRKDLGITDLQVGLTASLFLWTYGLFSPAAGYAGDRLPRRTVLIGSMMCWSSVTMLASIVRSPWQLIALRVLLAVAQVSYMPTAQALLTDFHGRDTQGKAIGIFQAGCYVGIFLAGLPAAYLATHFGWRTMFLVSGLVGWLLAAGLMFTLPGGNKNDGDVSKFADPFSGRATLSGAINLFRRRSILGIMVAFALASAAQWLVLTFLALFIFERHHLSLEIAAFEATFYLQAAGFIADPILGHWSDKFSARNAANRFVFCSWAGVIGLPGLLAVGYGHQTIVLVAGLVLFGTALAAADVSWMPMLSCVTSSYERATAFGYLNMAATLSGGAAAMLAAVTMNRVGLGPLIGFGGGLFCLMAPILIVTGRKFLPADMRYAEPYQVARE
jgi:predicted MFS family arabinose efflux permease